MSRKAVVDLTLGAPISDVEARYVQNLLFDRAAKSLRRAEDWRDAFQEDARRAVPSIRRNLKHARTFYRAALAVVGESTMKHPWRTFEERYNKMLALIESGSAPVTTRTL